MDIREVLKREIIKELKLEDISPEDIKEDAPLFGDGLGLDSLDAIELVVLVQRNFGVALDNAEEARQAFASLNSLAKFIESRRTP
ncbi:MAG: phosphopantetheine-binding protein [Desulfovibrio sp.]|jgi:acyl carrier protein|nr:phosphopantetheine-binding protein [Desulfovibrio sp.]